MNTKHVLTASLAGGLISLRLVNTPFLNLINLLVCAGFWIGPMVAVWLYRRLAGGITLRDALIIGVLAGAWHGVIGMAFSPLGLAGAGGLLSAARQLLPPQDWPDVEPALTGVGGLLFNLIGTAIDIAFGFVGGLVGGAIFRSDRAVDKSGIPL